MDKLQLLSPDTFEELPDHKKYSVYMLEHQRAEALTETVERLSKIDEHEHISAKE